MEVVTAAFAHVLKRTRKINFISQKDLALSCGLDRTFISMLERGIRQPSLQTIFIISKVLKITPADLIQQVDNQARRMKRARGQRLASTKL